MKKNLLIALLSAGCAYLATRSSVPVHAQAQGCSIPKASGKVIGGLADKFLIFEAPDGTVRLVNINGCGATLTFPRP